MKTLVVSYIARGPRSHTKKLLDSFLESTEGKDIEHLNLLKDVPDYFMETNLGAYIFRNYLGKELTEEQAKSIAKMDRMTEQFMKADIVVMAFPMYNFSMPAIIKAYFDSVMLKGKTWDMNEAGDGFKGLMNGKKALILMASGGVYEGDMKSWDHAISLTEQEFKFMGFEDVRHATVSGVNMMPDKLEEIEQKGQEKVKEIVKEWY